MHIRNTSAVVLLVTALALTGCAAPSGDAGKDEKTTTESSASAEPDAGAARELDAAPATGETVSGTGYTFVAPQGWGMPAGGIPGFDPDAFVANLQDADGFTDNLNIILSPIGPFTPDQIEATALVELKATATDVEVKERVMIGGVESVHVGAAMAVGETSSAVEQYYVSSDEEGYVVTFGFSETVPEADREALAESVLVTWEWN
jgi:hypothetical protein